MALTLSYAEHDGDLLDVFNDYFEKGSYMDVRFVCKGNKVAFAHKLVVASVSPLLRKLIYDMPCTDEVITLHLPDVNCNILILFLTFLYEGVMKLDIFELAEFKQVCNLLCVDIPNAEICEVPTESVSPPTVAPSFEQRVQKMSSQQPSTHQYAARKILPNPAHPGTNQTLNMNVPGARYPKVVVKREVVDGAKKPGTNRTANANTVQIKQEPPDNISEPESRSEDTGPNHHRRSPLSLNKPPDTAAGCQTVDAAAVDGSAAPTLSITNVVSLSADGGGGGGAEKDFATNRAQKRTRASKLLADPKYRAKKSLFSKEEGEEKKKRK